MRRLLLHLLTWMALPWVVWWAWRMERRILRHGRCLTDQETVNATRMGVHHPERLRILSVPQVPMPGTAWMQRIAARCGFDGSHTAGMALRYGIFIREDCGADPQLIAHECVHTAQYEKAGSLARFLRAYLSQCLIDGYWNAALEQEARARASAVSGQQFLS